MGVADCVSAVELWLAARSSSACGGCLSSGPAAHGASAEGGMGAAERVGAVEPWLRAGWAPQEQLQPWHAVRSSSAGRSEGQSNGRHGGTRRQRGGEVGRG